MPEVCFLVHLAVQQLPWEKPIRCVSGADSEATRQQGQWWLLPVLSPHEAAQYGVYNGDPGPGAGFEWAGSLTWAS